MVMVMVVMVAMVVMEMVLLLNVLQPHRPYPSVGEQIGGHILQNNRHPRAVLDQLVHTGVVDGLPKRWWPVHDPLDVLQDAFDLGPSPRRKHEDQRRSHVNAQLVLKTPELLKLNHAAPHVFLNNLTFGHGKGDPWQTPPVFGQDVLRIVVVMVMVVMVVMGGGGGGGGNGDGNGGNGGDGGDGDGNGGQAADR